MKKLIYVVMFPVLFVVYLISPQAVRSNWIKSEINSTQHSSSNQFNQDTHQSNSDSLPEGISQDWLNSLLDEDGNRIIPDSKEISEDPEGDAFQSTVFNGEANNNYLGYSVSSAGDVNGDGFDDILVGAYGYSSNKGRAYIYYGGTILNTVADVVMTGQLPGNKFGYSVSSAGDVNGDGYSDVIIGATGFNTNEGRVYIYLGGVSMNNVADFNFTGSTGDIFGTSVSSAGDVNNDGYDDVIIGASGYFGNTGYTIIYYGGDPMNVVADVFIAGGAAGNNFGYSVSDAGDVNNDGFDDVVVGAYAYNSTVGRAYLYFGGSPMNDVADVTYTGPSSSLWFGVSVSGAGDVNGDGFDDVIVGAMRYSSYKGRSYIFYGGSTPNNTADVTLTGEASSNYFGNSVSSAGDINDDGYDDVIIGAYGNSSFAGRAYIFFGGMVMNDTADVTISGEASGNFFGYSVSNAGDVNGNGFPDLLAGAYTYSSSTGRVYFYDYFMKNEIVSDLTLSSGESGDFFGYSVLSAGDVNGDGFSDVIVGAFADSALTGKSYIYFGGIIPDNIADVTLTGETDSCAFGRSVACAGDVNDDGYDDVIISAFLYSSETGRAYIYFGGSPMNNTADVIMTGMASDRWFGNTVSSAGDVNKDGYSDVIVGTNIITNSGGKAYIFLGGASMDNTPDVILTNSYSFGRAVSSAGDVNDDGYSDVIVGETGFANTAGKAYIYFGGAIMNNIADVILNGETADSYFGYSVSTAGDVNGDGYSDVIVGAHKYNSNSGKVYIFLGESVMDNTADLTITGLTGERDFGWSVSTAGDVNKDGYSDVIVGTFIVNSGNVGFGRAYIYFGGVSLNYTVDVTMTTEELVTSIYGVTVSSAGDVNGDGYSDVIIGNREFATSNGKAYIYLGSAKAPLSMDLKMYIEGFYNSGSNSQVSDSVSVELRNSASPFAVADQTKGIVESGGNLHLTFLDAPSGNYYFAIKHRNSIETWSAVPFSFTSGISTVIDFSMSITQAYGNNQKQVDASPVRFGIFSGDENQNGTVDLTDVVNVSNAASSFTTGYVSTDMNGNNITDLSDLVITSNNASAFVSAITP